MELRPVRVRSAGGLLLAPLLALIASALEASNVAFGTNRVETFVKTLFWPEPDGARETIVVLVRDGIFGLAFLVGLAALFGLRQSRWPAVFMSAVLVVLHVPWLIWNFDARTFRNPPPDWVFKYLPWYRFGRYTALLWVLVLLAAMVFALTEQATVVRPAAPVAGPPPGPPPVQPTSGPIS